MNINDFKLSEKLRVELSSAISAGKLPHAIIVEKGDYQSRLDFACFLSACFLCRDEKKPCGDCSDCYKAFGKFHPDISYYEHEKDRKEFSVKIVKNEIIPSVYIKPGEAEGKVCIIKDAETMNSSSQNAFLKILEEPPANVKFILCCDVASSMLETIRSRATVYSLASDKKMTDEDMIKAAELAQKLVECLMFPTEYDFMAETGVFEKDRTLLVNTLSQMQIIFRNAVFIKNGAAVESDCPVAEKAASFFGMNNLMKLIEKTNELNNFVDKNANLNLLLTRLCSCLRQAARG